MRPRSRDLLHGRGEKNGRLFENVMQFCRLLRRAGLPIGPERGIRALEAIAAVGVMQRSDVYWALHSSVLSRPEQQKVFDEAFRMFWRDPFGANEAISIILPASKVPEHEEKKPSFARRVMEAWQPPRDPSDLPPPQGEERLELDAVMTFSPTETLRSKDFEQMSAEEIREAEAMIRRMRLPFAKIRQRRFEAYASGERVDLRRTLRGALRSGGEPMVLAQKRRKQKPPPLVVLCDVSGSMERYSRMFVHLLHGLTNSRGRVETFLFGTRLNHVTRALRHRDIDVALRVLGEEVKDWSGGTRIATTLHRFNRIWARRVLGQNAVVLLITDGLDRDSEHRLGFEAERLRKSCHRLIWLNPLLRFSEFEPRAAGIQALLPHVDDFRPMHNLNSLKGLLEALAAPDRARKPLNWI
ncbi:MAG: VWA domain-containing protein [Myxococcota bacterium]